MAVNNDAVCRMCRLQRARTRKETGDARLPYERALAGGVQLSLADTHAQERRRSRRPPPAPPAVRQAPAGHRQLTLFPAPRRDLRAGMYGRFPPPPLPVLEQWLCAQLTQWAAAHGWSPRKACKARHGLRIVLGLQDTPGAPVPASLTRQLTRLHLPARLLQEFLTAHHFAEDDRVSALQAWCARTTAHLPRPMAGQLAAWLDARTRPSAASTPARSPATVRHQLSFALPVLTRLADAGTSDLADVTPLLLHRHLTACHLTPSASTHTASGLRAIFSTLTRHRIIGADPTTGLPVGAAARTVPVPADLTLIRQDLHSPDTARAAITALLVFHALRPGAIRHLTLHDARDLHAARLYLPHRTITLAEPVRTRLAGYLTHRATRWPDTANPHLFLSSHSALSTGPVSAPLIRRHHTAASQLLRDDRILDEAWAPGGDVRMLCELFGLTVPSASRYTATRTACQPTPLVQ
ncbi:hypothetical protein [Streptomyces sp. IBSBF 2806]|uniref:hypothetical protein n=1 Tax=Streptomyces sp. IBSBF 2806 TaxID=2903529 RepID=UPI002FDC2507